MRKETKVMTRKISKRMKTSQSPSGDETITRVIQNPPTRGTKPRHEIVKAVKEVLNGNGHRPSSKSSDKAGVGVAKK